MLVEAIDYTVVRRLSVCICVMVERGPGECKLVYSVALDLPSPAKPYCLGVPDRAHRSGRVYPRQGQPPLVSFFRPRGVGDRKEYF